MAEQLVFSKSTHTYLPEYAVSHPRIQRILSRTKTFKEKGGEGVTVVMGFIWLPCNMNNWQAVVNMVINLETQYNAGTFLLK